MWGLAALLGACRGPCIVMWLAAMVVGCGAAVPAPLVPQSPAPTEPPALALAELSCAELRQSLEGFDPSGIRDAPWLRSVGLSWAECGAMASAERYLRLSLVHADTCEVRRMLSEIILRRGARDRAIDELSRSVERHPSCFEGALELSAWLRRAGRSREATDRARLALGVATEDARVRALDALALALVDLRDEERTALDQAELVCTEALAADHLHAPAHNTCGLVALYRADSTVALQRFESAYVVDPSFFEARMNYAQLVLEYRDFDSAFASFEAALDIRPRDYDALLGRGVAARALGRTGDARAAYEAALEVDSARPEAWFNLGVLLQEHGSAPADVDLARECLQRFVEAASGEADFASRISDARARLARLAGP